MWMRWWKLFLKKNFFFVNKPPNIAVHAEEGIAETYQERVQEFWKKKYTVRFLPDMLHRLEKAGSGLMVFAKSLRMEQHYRSLQYNEDYVSHCWIKKGYIAVVRGRPPKDEGLVEGKISKSRYFKRFWISNHKGRPMQTYFKFITEQEHPTYGTLSFMLFITHKSYRHQIRTTAAALGTPILGDKKYGGDEFPICMMHAAYQGFKGTDKDRVYSVSLMPDWNEYSSIWTTKAQFWTTESLKKLNENPLPVQKAPPRVSLSRRTRLRLLREEEEEIFKPPEF